MRDLPGHPDQVVAARVWSAEELSAFLAPLPQSALILDLTRQGLSPFFGAREVCGQLNLAFEALLEDLPPVLLPKQGRIEAAHIGSWIDFELFGDAPRIVADRVADAAQCEALAVLLPFDIEQLSRADGLLVARLIAKCRAQGLAVALGFPALAYTLPESWGCGAVSVAGPTATVEHAPELPPGRASEGIAAKLRLLGARCPRP